MAHILNRMILIVSIFAVSHPCTTRVLAAMGTEATTTGGSKLVFIEIPEDMTVDEAISGDKIPSLRMSRKLSEKGAMSSDAVSVIVYTKDGVPILPDLEKADLSCRYAGKCTFSEIKLDIVGSDFRDGGQLYQDVFDTVYEWIVEIIGEPAFDITVKLISTQGNTYGPSSNTISVTGSNSVGTFVHELTHAFNDDLSPGNFDLNEGLASMVANVIIERLNDEICANPSNFPAVLVNAVDNPETPDCDKLLAYGRNNNEPRQVFFSNYNKIGMSDIVTGYLESRNREVPQIGEYPSFIHMGQSVDNIATYRGYEYVLYDLYKNIDSLFSDIVQSFYVRSVQRGLNYRIFGRVYDWLAPEFVTSFNDVMSNQQSTLIDGLSYSEWLSQTYLLSNDGQAGYNVILGAHLTDDNLPEYFLTYFYHDPTEPGRIIVDDMILSNVILISKDWNGNDVCFSDELDNNRFQMPLNSSDDVPQVRPMFCSDVEFDGENGRITTTAIVETPEGPVSDVSYLYRGAPSSGLFGVITNRMNGSITITNLDNPDIVNTVAVTNGGFQLPNVGRGRYRLEYRDDDWSTIKDITKDDPRFFVVLTASSANQPDLLFKSPSNSIFTNEAAQSISVIASENNSSLTHFHPGTGDLNTIELMNSPDEQEVAIQLSDGANLLTLNSDGFDYSFATPSLRVYLDTSKPVLIDNSRWPIGIINDATQTVTVSIYDNESGISTASLSIRKESGEFQSCEPVYWLNNEGYDSIKLLYFADEPFQINATYTIRLAIRDRAGNDEVQEWEFRTIPVNNYTATLSPGWNMIGLPVFFFDDSIINNEDFQEIEGDLYTHLESSSNNDIYGIITSNSALFEPLYPTQGYLFYNGLSATQTLSFNNVTRPRLEGDSSRFIIQLHNGFNLIAPYFNGISLLGVNNYYMVKLLSDDRIQISRHDYAVMNNWIAPVVSTFESKTGHQIMQSCDYARANNTKAYWFYVPPNDNVKEISMIVSNSRGLDNDCGNTDQGDGTWSYKIRAQIDGREFADEVYIGEKTGAKDELDHERDSYDYPAPPVFPTNYNPEIIILMTNDNEIQYKSDFRETNNVDEMTRKEWDFTVQHSNIADGATITIYLDVTEMLPSSYTTYLQDLDSVTGSTQFIFPDYSMLAWNPNGVYEYSYVPDEISGSRRFRLILTPRIGIIKGRLILDGNPQDDNINIMIEASSDPNFLNPIQSRSDADGKFEMSLPVPADEGASSAMYRFRFSKETYITDITPDYIAVIPQGTTTLLTEISSALGYVCPVLDSNLTVIRGRNRSCIRGGNAQFEPESLDHDRISIRTNTGNMPDYHDWASGASGTYIYDTDHLLWHWGETQTTTSPIWNPPMERADINKDRSVDNNDLYLIKQAFGCEETTCGDHCIPRIQDDLCGVLDTGCTSLCELRWNTEFEAMWAVPWHAADFDGDGHVLVADWGQLNSAIQSGSTDVRFDLNGDTSVNGDDRTVFLRVIGWNGTDHGDRCLLTATATVNLCGIRDTECNTQCARNTITDDLLSWRDADLTNPTGGLLADSVDIEDFVAFGAQYGNQEWGTGGVRADIDGDQRVSYKDYYMVATQSLGVNLIGPAPSSPGDPPNADTCFYEPSFYEAAKANPAGFTWCQTNGTAPCQANCLRHYATGNLIRMADADLNFDNVIDIADIVLLGTWYNQGHGRNDRDGFERVNWFRDNDLSLEDWIRFARGKTRCEAISEYDGVLAICHVCDDDETSTQQDDYTSCCSNTDENLPRCNW